MGELGQPHRQPAAGGYRLRRLPFRGGAAPAAFMPSPAPNAAPSRSVPSPNPMALPGFGALGHPAAGNRLRRSLAALAGQPQQWHQLSHPAGRGGRPFPHRTAAAAKGPCPLPAECRPPCCKCFTSWGSPVPPAVPAAWPPTSGSAVRMAPDAQNSWAWFHRLLEGCGVLCAPGAGFGQMGEGWLRFTAFSRPEDTAEALRRMEHFLR